MTLDVSLDGEALVAVGTAELVGVRLVLLHHVGAHLLLSNILMNKHKLFVPMAHAHLYALRKRHISNIPKHLQILTENREQIRKLFFF